MSQESIPPRPAPLVVANLLAKVAWRPDIDESLRQLLEWGSESIRARDLDYLRVESRVEHLEAENETYARALYGPNQKGGAA